MKLTKLFLKSEFLNCTKMSRILLVSDSNFVNNIGTYKGQKIRNLEVTSCQTRKAALQEIASVEQGIVVFSCLDMMAADISKTTPSGADAAVELYVNQFLFKIVDRVDETDGKVAFGVLAPLFWSSHSQPVSRALNHAFKLLKATPLAHVWFSGFMNDVRAGTDGVHLTSQSADRYIKHIFDFVTLISDESGQKCVEFEPLPEGSDPTNPDWTEEAGDVRMEEVGQALIPPADVPSPARTSSMLSVSLLAPVGRQTSSSSGYANTQSRLIRMANPYVNPLPDLSLPPPTSAATNSNQIISSLARLERRVGSLESNSFYNNLMTAGLKEELDTEANKAMLNRVTVSGVELPELQRMNDVDKIKAMKTKIVEIFDLLKAPDQVYEVVFVRHLNSQIRGAKTAVIEVKLADTKQAKDIRTEFVKKRKELSDKLNISPVVRLATRVRIEIMHSVADLLKRHDHSISSAYCLQYIPKPVIKIKRRSTPGGQEVTRTMAFCEAISWVQENVLQNVIDLKKARGRAGAAFRATLAQHFVLLD